MISERRLTYSTRNSSHFGARQRLIGLHPVSHDRAKQEQADAAQELKVRVLNLFDYATCPASAKGRTPATAD
jgi:hypothetical protein